MDYAMRHFSLTNGLRVVHCRCSGGVEYCGVAINAGSRDETVGREGLAHFVEHTIFKGTAHRRSWHIVNRMECVGGELNAYTSKEETVVYSCFPKGHLQRAMELISDLVTSSIFPTPELNREREVVADEINSYLDSPAEAVFDEFDDCIFSGSSLGHNILGTVESINGFTSEVCREYLESYFIPGEMVLFYFGPSSVSSVEKAAMRYFGAMPIRASVLKRVAPPVLQPFDECRDMGYHQSHTIIGARIGGINSRLSYAMALLTNIIGGPGMNSLLNMSLREKRGLVYTVEASTSLYSDCGLLTVYFGCDRADLKKCRRLVFDTLEHMACDGLSERMLERAKRQYVGQLAVSAENHEQMATSIGRSILYKGSANTVEQTAERIKALTRNEVLEAAEMIRPENCSCLTLI